MDVVLGEAFIEILSWSLRLLFWPAGLIIKYREFLGAVISYLLVGIVGFIIIIAGLGFIEGTRLAINKMYRVLGAIVCGFRLLAESNSQRPKSCVLEPPVVLKDQYRLLGVAHHVDPRELAARYRHLLSMNHPDKVAQLDPEIQAFATERCRRIIEAYAIISSERIEAKAKDFR